MNPQFSSTAVEASTPQVVVSLSPCEEFSAPVYNQVHQEQIVAGEMTPNLVENPAVQEQTIVQENSELQLMERIQEQIVEPIEVPLQEHVQALGVLENVFHDGQRRFDRCVQVLKREKERLRVLKERGVVPSHELQSLRSHIQSGKDTLADAARDLYECNQQIKRRRLCESILADGMTDFHKSVNIWEPFPS